MKLDGSENSIFHQRAESYSINPNILADRLRAMSSEYSKRPRDKTIDSGFRRSMNSNSIERHSPSNQQRSQKEEYGLEDGNVSDIFASDEKEFENDLMQSMYLKENSNEEVVD